MLDLLRPEFNLSSEDPATPEVSRFFKLLKDSEEPLHVMSWPSEERLGPVEGQLSGLSDPC